MLKNNDNDKKTINRQDFWGPVTLLYSQIDSSVSGAIFSELIFVTGQCGKLFLASFFFLLLFMSHRIALILYLCKLQIIITTVNASFSVWEEKLKERIKRHTSDALLWTCGKKSTTNEIATWAGFAADHLLSTVSFNWAQLQFSHITCGTIPQQPNGWKIPEGQFLKSLGQLVTRSVSVAAAEPCPWLSSEVLRCLKWWHSSCVYTL